MILHCKLDRKLILKGKKRKTVNIDVITAVLNITLYLNLRKIRRYYTVKHNWLNLNRASSHNNVTIISDYITFRLQRDKCRINETTGTRACVVNNLSSINKLFCAFSKRLFAKGNVNYHEFLVFHACKSRDSALTSACINKNMRTNGNSLPY